MRVEQLTKEEATLSMENDHLQTRLKKFIEANREVTTHHTTVKKNYALKKLEMADLASEMGESKSACQLLIKQKNDISATFQAAQDVIKDLEAKKRGLDALILRKSAEFCNLII